MHNFELNYQKLISFLTLIFLCIYFLIPSYRYLLYEENQLVENITALTLLITFFISLRINNVSENPKKKLFLTISIVSILGFLDEISYGGRSINLNIPYLGVKSIDGFHDFLNISKAILYRFTTIGYGNFFLIIFSSITLILFIKKVIFKFKQKILLFLKKFFILRISKLALIFIIISQIIDIFPSRFELPLWIKSIEEIFEMYVAFALFTITMILKRVNFSI